MDYLTIAPDVDEVVRVQAVLLVQPKAQRGVEVAQGEDHAGLQATFWVCRYHGMQPVGHLAGFALRLDVPQQVHAEVVQTQVGDRNAGFQVFQFDHFFLQAAQLFFAV